MFNAEGIDNHLEQHHQALNAAHQAATTNAARLNPQQAIQAVCTSYQAIKPILLGVQSLFFFRQSWKDAVGKFTGVLDTLCP